MILRLTLATGHLSSRWHRNFLKGLSLLPPLSHLSLLSLVGFLNSPPIPEAFTVIFFYVPQQQCSHPWPSGGVFPVTSPFLQCLSYSLGRSSVAGALSLCSADVRCRTRSGPGPERSPVLCSLSSLALPHWQLQTLCPSGVWCLLLTPLINLLAELRMHLTSSSKCPHHTPHSACPMGTHDLCSLLHSPTCTHVIFISITDPVDSK